MIFNGVPRASRPAAQELEAHVMTYLHTKADDSRSKAKPLAKPGKTLEKPRLEHVEATKGHLKAV